MVIFFNLNQLRSAEGTSRNTPETRKLFSPTENTEKSIFANVFIPEKSHGDEDSFSSENFFSQAIVPVKSLGYPSTK